MPILPALAAILLLLSAPLRAGSHAGPPQVVTDIPPVQGLVAEVMGEIGTPAVLLGPAASPHGFSLRPSQARALQGADLVIWIGPELTPWLEGPIAALAGDASQLRLLDHPATLRLPLRGGAGGLDPHAWLDPENARAWLPVIAAALARIDPANGGRYAANAAAAQLRIARAEARVARILAGAPPYVALHDAYQYFERRFGLTLIGTVAAGDAAPPGPARLARLRAAIRGRGIVCAFREPQQSPDLLETVLEGSGIVPRVLDPLGAGLEAGPGFYVALIERMARVIAGCVSG